MGKASYLHPPRAVVVEAVVVVSVVVVVVVVLVVAVVAVVVVVVHVVVPESGHVPEQHILTNMVSASRSPSHQLG